ncbi:hypothetical protein PASE110613_10725 [Paenibacillus sediminis]|uniref:Uncharacterized protein n=1 Tax=Paenibacillus sediminis TaxID=664909 RepID=A0ABS4H4G3_9BACL|nr:hypothetical protein [Paenibacillus sediminis]MBP1937427.1 hypothetical protein [Paenibacillus sediminis]
MSYRPNITNLKLASSNEKDGLYEFIITMADGTECRSVFHRHPKWKMTAISRLLNIPCPVCRKDFICKCMEKYVGDLEQQIEDHKWIEKAIAQ